jgi:hypothetical protein
MMEETLTFVVPPANYGLANGWRLSTASDEATAGREAVAKSQRDAKEVTLDHAPFEIDEFKSDEAQKEADVIETFARPGADNPNVILHHRIAAGKAVFDLQPFTNPLRRVPLLRRRLAIVSRLSPKTRAASRRLFPSTKTDRRTAA